VCITCGQVLDIEIPERVERLLDEGLAPTVADAGFVMTGHRLDLLGRCAACR
jgi:Fe2+ or Zn2+ uptake regulation protein